MRIGNLDDRLVIITDDGAVDVAEASDGRFPSDPQAIYDCWAEFTAWADEADTASATSYDAARLGAPAPRAPQVFGIGLNYRDHAAEADIAVPDSLTVFTKFVSSFAGPESEVSLTSDSVDYEAELVVVIGKAARNVAADVGWDHVAGLAVGQDYSDRPIQMSGPVPQFSLGKSLPGYSPFGPFLVTPDEVPDKDDLLITCTVSGEVLQRGRTSDMVFSVPDLVADLSAKLTLLPGDVIFTGTPAGVGIARKPARFLKPGDEVITSIEGIGTITQRFVSA